MILENETKVQAIKLILREKIDLRDFEILKAFSSKVKNGAHKSVYLKAFAPVLKSDKIAGIELIPWESISGVKLP